MEDIVVLKPAKVSVEIKSSSPIENIFINIFCIFSWTLILCIFNIILSLSDPPPIIKGKQEEIQGMTFQARFTLIGGLFMVLFIAYHFYITTRTGPFSLEEILEEEEEEEEEEEDVPKPQKPKVPDQLYTRPPPTDKPLKDESEEQSNTTTPNKKPKPPPTWSTEEMSLLAKALAKYPGGTVGRWDKITEMINTISNRTQKEVIVKCREIDLLQQRGVGKDEAFKRYLDNKQGRLSAKEDSKTRQIGSETDSQKASVKSPVKDTDSEWNAEQQKAFEMALKTVSKGEDRWDQIAALVPGKTKQECVARFKEIRAKIIAQKGVKNKEE